MTSHIRQKVIAIVGPTASGKSAWAVKLAKKFNGVVISADSRQVYKGLDVATAKITETEMKNVPHFLLDVVKPTENFDVATYQRLVYQLLKQIDKHQLVARGKPLAVRTGGAKQTKKNILPIIAGGTGLYVQAVLDGYVFSSAKPDLKLRAKLEAEPLEKLERQLKKLNPEVKIDFKNPRRVIRALEIALQQGSQPTKKHPKFDTLKIGIKLSSEEQEKRIVNRIRQMNFEKLADETKKLISQKFNFNSNPLTALYYRFAKDWVEKKITKSELIEKLIRADKQYAKRQMTWFKKDPAVHWVATYSEAQSLVDHYTQI